MDEKPISPQLACNLTYEALQRWAEIAPPEYLKEANKLLAGRGGFHRVVSERLLIVLLQENLAASNFSARAVANVSKNTEAATTPHWTVTKGFWVAVASLVIGAVLGALSLWVALRSRS